MPGLKSATYKRVITITAIIFATVDRNYYLHEAVNVQTIRKTSKINNAIIVRG